MSHELARLLPECSLMAGLLLVLAVDLFLPPARRRVLGWIGAVTCAAATWLAWAAESGPIGTLLVVDGISRLVRPLLCAFGALWFVAADRDADSRADRGALAVAMLGLVLGSLLTTGSTHLLMLWIGIELMSLPSYVLAAWRGGDRKAAEAGMKYVLFGGFASGLMVFGLSHVYGITGSLEFALIAASLAQGMPVAVAAALGLAAVGVLYKLAIVPLHFYAPDVYQGAPALSVAAVGVLPKLGAIAALGRALVVLQPSGFVSVPQVSQVLAAAAVASMLVSAFTALVQRDAKRILAFSAIGHAGTALLALAALPGELALAAAGFHLLTYGVATFGALVCLAGFEREPGGTSLEALAGAGRRQPWQTAALCLFLGSLAGIPPLAGFVGKFGVLAEVVSAGMSEAHGGRKVLVLAALALLLTTVVSAWSYLLIVRAAILAPAPAAPTPTAAGGLGWGERCVVLVCAVAALGLGFWFDGLGVVAALLP